MKRINAIVKAVKGLTEFFQRKAARVIRAVENAQASALDHADACKEEAEEIINKFGDCAEGSEESRNKLQELLNNYAAKREEADRWTRYAGYFDELKEKLNEEVEIEPEA